MRTLCTFTGAYVLTLVTVLTLAAIAVECVRRARVQRAIRVVTRPSLDVHPLPIACRHPHEALDQSLYSKVAFKCLDCGALRIVGEVWFGASNYKKRHAA